MEVSADRPVIEKKEVYSHLAMKDKKRSEIKNQ